MGSLCEITWWNNLSCPILTLMAEEKQGAEWQDSVLGPTDDDTQN